MTVTLNNTHTHTPLRMTHIQTATHMYGNIHMDTVTHRSLTVTEIRYMTLMQLHLHTTAYTLLQVKCNYL